MGWVGQLSRRKQRKSTKPPVGSPEEHGTADSWTKTQTQHRAAQDSEQAWRRGLRGAAAEPRHRLRVQSGSAPCPALGPAPGLRGTALPGCAPFSAANPGLRPGLPVYSSIVPPVIPRAASAYLLPMFLCPECSFLSPLSEDSSTRFGSSPMPLAKPFLRFSNQKPSTL